MQKSVYENSVDKKTKYIVLNVVHGMNFGSSLKKGSEKQQQVQTGPADKYTKSWNQGQN